MYSIILAHEPVFTGTTNGSTAPAILVNLTFTYALSDRVEIVAKLVNTPLTRIEQPRNARRRNCRVAIDGARFVRRNFRRVIGIDCDNFQLF